jgi:hypothetical protein
MTVIALFPHLLFVARAHLPFPKGTANIFGILENKIYQEFSNPRLVPNLRGRPISKQEI